MIRKFAALLAVLLVPVSCDKKQDRPETDATVRSGPRATRSGNPSREAPSTRGRLRAAFEAAKSKETGGERNTALAEVATNALEVAPDIAAEVIGELPAGIEEKQALIEAYIRMLMTAEKSEEAIAWADTLGDERDIAFARGRVALLLAERNPEQAAKLLPVSGFAAAGVDPAAMQVLQSWVAIKPDGAVAWAAHLPAGEARTAGFKVIFTQWINNDSPAAFSWIASQTNPQVRRETINAMIGVFNELPDPIREVLLEPADPALRTEIERGIAEIAPPDAEPMPETESTPADETEPSPESP